MSRRKDEFRVPSDAEEARIQAGIAAGPGQPRMDRGRFPAGKAVRQDVPRPGEKPTGTRAARTPVWQRRMYEALKKAAGL